MNDYFISFIQLTLVIVGFYLIFKGSKNIIKGLGIIQLIKILKNRGE